MGFCGLPRKLMKRNSTSSRNRTNASLVETVPTDMRAKYSTELSSYISACQEDSNLKAFDYSLHERTKKLFSSLASQAEKTQSLSPVSLTEVYEFLCDLNQEAVTVIVGSKEDVRKNKKLMSLVKAYFESTSKTLNFYKIADNCVKKLENSQLIIRSAVKQFETESLGENDNKKKYAKTLEELNQFKAIGDPFDGEFETRFMSVYEEQLQLLKELRKNNVKLGKKRKNNAKTWKLLSNVVFATTVVSLLVLTVVLAALNAPAVIYAWGAYRWMSR